MGWSRLAVTDTRTTPRHLAVSKDRRRQLRFQVAGRPDQRLVLRLKATDHDHMIALSTVVSKVATAAVLGVALLTSCTASPEKIPPESTAVSTPTVPSTISRPNLSMYFDNHLKIYKVDFSLCAETTPHDDVDCGRTLTNASKMAESMLKGRAPLAEIHPDLGWDFFAASDDLVKAVDAVRQANCYRMGTEPRARDRDGTCRALALSAGKAWSTLSSVAATY